MNNLTWWEVVEDLGDGSAVVRRFSTEQFARKYIEVNDLHGWGDEFLAGPYEISFGCDGFFNDRLEESLFWDSNE